MTYITFKQQFTFPTEAVIGFAIFLGWEATLQRRVAREIIDENGHTLEVEDIETYQNPQTFAQFVDTKAREHALIFTKSWAESLKEEYLNVQIEKTRSQIEPVLYAQIIKPVEDALVSEIIAEDSEKETNPSE